MRQKSIVLAQQISPHKYVLRVALFGLLFMARRTGQILIEVLHNVEQIKPYHTINHTTFQPHGRCVHLNTL